MFEASLRFGECSSNGCALGLGVGEAGGERLNLRFACRRVITGIFESLGRRLELRLKRVDLRR